MEMTIEIAGKVGGSLGSSFKKATGDIDGLKKQSYAAQRELSRLGREFSKGNIHQTQYATETAKVRSELRKLEGDMRRVNAVSSTLQRGWAKTKAVVGVAAVAGAAAITTATVKSVNVAADFESQMSKVQAKTQASSTELNDMRATAIGLGASTTLSASETAIAMDSLAAKGFDANKIIAAMPGIISAAEASGEDLALVSDVVTSAINSYGLEAGEASRVADILSMSANKTAAGVMDLGQSFKYAAPVSKALGISIEELTAVTGGLVDKGLAGEQAGTALRSSLLKLSEVKTQKTLKAMGVEVIDTAGKFKSIADITGEWNEATKDLSDTQKVAKTKMVFGTESATAMLNVFDMGPEKIKKMTAELENSTGAAAEAAAVMKDNFEGSKTEFFGAIESGQIAFATPILGVLKDTFQGLTGSVEQNIAAFEKLGEKTATALGDILEPFSTMKPELTPEMKVNPVLMEEYEAQMAKYITFKDMDLGDKIVYSLETATKKAEEWLGGSGGEAMGRIFSQLGEIAAKTWVSAFTGAVGGSINAALEGNVTGALGLGAAAWMLGGGTAVKGAIGAGRWAMESRSAKKSATAADTAGQTVTTQNTTSKKNKQKKNNQTNATAQKESTKTKKNNKNQKTKVTAQPKAVSKSKKTGKLGSRAINTGKNLLGKGGNSVGKIAKVGSKAMLPLAIVGEAMNIFKSKDKVKASGQAAGGLAGGAGGAKLGAAIGTVIAPGIGTAIGGFVGGIGGYIGGKWAAGKAVDSARGDGSSGTATADKSINPVNNVKQATFDSEQLNASANELAVSLAASNASMSELHASTSLTAQNMVLFASETGQASQMMTGAFQPLQESSSAITHNLSALAMVTGEASGMIYGSFYPLQENTNITAHNMSLLTSYVGEASGMISGSFFPLQANTNLASNNMSLLASYIGQASGWIASLHGIQSASQRVVSALNNLESRINNVPLPGGTSKRVSFDG